MGKALQVVALLSAILLIGCADDGSGSGGTAGAGGSAGTGGSTGTGGDGGTGATMGTGGNAGSGGSGGMGGGTTVAPCTDDGECGPEDDCVCPECDTDLFCSDPENCVDDDVCNEFTEGCVCADCADNPRCER